MAAIPISMTRAEPEEVEDGISRSSEASVRDVPAIVGANLRRLRKGQGFSLEKLAELSGVSRAMLGQIETAKSVPTVSLLWRVADALGVPVASLMATEREPSVVVIRRDNASVLVASDGQYATRSLAPVNRARSTGFFEVTFAPGHRERFQASAIGTHHNLAIARGRLLITVGDEPPVTLEEGDSIAFEASRPHAIENISASLVSAFLVVISSTG
ncbi:XRE family transcriptional regulator [Hyphomicrobium sp. CS1GBMeth3]|uniref:helix-turn-helix domain-containing protein n=1 Tax=Hyphomicrobium sp. CS1GBMeth3 TaxID=1892845 RepID=UPI001FCDAB4C|nr:XRE family transcriptional regulator [Hyphomicrobium sp. CS1GBMeth3]